LVASREGASRWLEIPRAESVKQICPHFSEVSHQRQHAPRKKRRHRTGRTEPLARASGGERPVICKHGSLAACIGDLAYGMSRRCTPPYPRSTLFNIMSIALGCRGPSCERAVLGADGSRAGLSAVCSALLDPLHKIALSSPENKSTDCRRSFRAACPACRGEPSANYWRRQGQVDSRRAAGAGACFSVAQRRDRESTPRQTA
jgi:hypothetical protein